MSIVRWIVLPCLASGLLVVLLAAIIRWIVRISRPLGAIVATGFGLRLVIALALFWTSYLQLPVLSSLQLGRGFWRMALDAFVYYDVALYAAEGDRIVPPSAPSKAYVDAVALWLSVFGTSPFSPVLLNLACYVGTCALLIAVLRGLPERWRLKAGAVLLLGVSLSPMSLFISAQALKDAFFLFFAVLLSAGVWLLARVLSEPSLASWQKVVPALLAISVGTYITAGVRIYYPAISTVCVGAALVSIVLMKRHAPWRLIAGSSAAIAAVMLSAVLFGSPEGSSYVRLLMGMGAASPTQMLEQSRRGFAGTGGSTNVAEAPTEPGRGMSLKLPPIGVYIRAVAVGLATLFVPLVILNALSVVNVTNSLFMMAVGDVDTVFFDLVVASTGWLAWRLWREQKPNVPYLVFAVTLGLMLAVLMSYIVTNVGTLVRLRLMLLVPSWTLLFAFSSTPAFIVSDAASDLPPAEPALSGNWSTKAG
jgi:hypothetical protein